MKQHYVNKVAELQISLAKKIKDAFLNVSQPPTEADKEMVIEFNEPFVIYQAEYMGDDEYHIKVPYICNTLRGGEYLSGEVGGNAFDELSIKDVENTLEVAYILDIISEGKYKIIDYV